MKRALSSLLAVLLLTSCALNNQNSEQKEVSLSISEYNYARVRTFKKGSTSSAAFYLDHDNTLWKSGFSNQENKEYGFESMLPSPSGAVPIMKNVEHIIGSRTVERNYLLAISDNKELYGFGSNVSGALLEKYSYPIGSNASNWIEDNQYPSPKLLMKDVAYACTDNGFVMALKTDGTLWGWGDNLTGQVGNGEKAPQDSMYTFDMPFIVEYPYLIMEDVVLMDTDGRSGIALKKDGSIWTWGDNSQGLIGNGEKGNGFPTASNLVVLKPIKILDNIQDVWFGGSQRSDLTLSENILGNLYAKDMESNLYVWGKDYSENPIILS